MTGRNNRSKCKSERVHLMATCCALLRERWNVHREQRQNVLVWRPKMISITVAKSQCCTVTCVFDRDILARGEASITSVVCPNSASGTMDHTKGLDATTQEQRRLYTRTDSTYRLSQESNIARIYSKNVDPKIGVSLPSFPKSVHTQQS